jgi:hypothetical protein
VSARLDIEVLRDLEQMHRDCMKIKRDARPRSGASLMPRPEPAADVESGPLDEEEILQPRWLRLRGF